MSGYTISYAAAVVCAMLLAGLGVASAEADNLGIDRQALGWIAVGTACVGVLAAVLPSIRQPHDPFVEGKKAAGAPELEPKPPGPVLEEPHE